MRWVGVLLWWREVRKRLVVGKGCQEREALRNRIGKQHKALASRNAHYSARIKEA